MPTTERPGRFEFPDGRVLTWTEVVTDLAPGRREIFRKDFRLNDRAIDDDEGEGLLR